MEAKQRDILKKHIRGTLIALAVGLPLIFIFYVFIYKIISDAFLITLSALAGIILGETGYILLFIYSKRYQESVIKRSDLWKSLSFKEKGRLTIGQLFFLIMAMILFMFPFMILTMDLIFSITGKVKFFEQLDRSYKTFFFRFFPAHSPAWKLLFLLVLLAIGIYCIIQARRFGQKIKEQKEKESSLIIGSDNAGKG